MPIKVNEPSPEVSAMNEVYTIVEDVLSGTLRMRSKAADYLPQRRIMHRATILGDTTPGAQGITIGGTVGEFIIKVMSWIGWIGSHRESAAWIIG